MDEGRIQEQGRPLDLLQNPKGAFSSLVNELDADSVANIRALALEASNMSRWAVNHMRSWAMSHDSVANIRALDFLALSEDFLAEFLALSENS